MIRAQQMKQHTADTGHEVIALDGVATCSDCTWQYPPDPWQPTPDQIASTDDPPADPTDHEEDDCERCRTDAAELAAEPDLNDPGPDPDPMPDVPPLTLRNRIENVLGTYFGMDDPNPGLGSQAEFDELVDTVHAAVGAGADWTPRTEAIELTPQQALAYLLDLDEWSRIDRIGALLTQSRAGSDCFLMDHAALQEAINAYQVANQRYHDALTRIARLTSTIDQPESAGQNIIGQIATEALTHRD